MSSFRPPDLLPDCLPRSDDAGRDTCRPVAPTQNRGQESVIQQHCAPACEGHGREQGLNAAANIPTRFTFRFIDQWSPILLVELQAGTVQFEVGGLRPSPIRTVVPTAASWGRLRRALDREKVWGWRALFGRTNAGSHRLEWMLEVAFADRALNCRG